jgi:hypothetical protein
MVSDVYVDSSLTDPELGAEAERNGQNARDDQDEKSGNPKLKPLKLKVLVRFHWQILFICSISRLITQIERDRSCSSSSGH